MTQRIGRFLFRHRGIAPVPLVVAFVTLARPSAAWLLAGAPLLVAGELLRLWSVAYAGLGTRGREIGAERLSTSGPYARVRNPIYIGNFLLCVAAAVMAGFAESTGRAAVAASFLLLFAFQYAAIVHAEEAFLRKRFGAAFERYARAVPAWLPAIVPRPEASAVSPRWKEAIRSERDTMVGIAALVVALLVRMSLPGGWSPL